MNTHVETYWCHILSNFLLSLSEVFTGQTYKLINKQNQILLNLAIWTMHILKKQMLVSATLIRMHLSNPGAPSV